MSRLIQGTEAVLQYHLQNALRTIWPRQSLNDTSGLTLVRAEPSGVTIVACDIQVDSYDRTTQMLRYHDGDQPFATIVIQRNSELATRLRSPGGRGYFVVRTDTLHWAPKPHPRSRR